MKILTLLLEFAALDVKRGALLISQTQIALQALYFRQARVDTSIEVVDTVLRLLCCLIITAFTQ